MLFVDMTAIQSSMTALRARSRQEWARFVLGARRAGGCVAVAGIWVGAWVLGVWVLGSHCVYAEASSERGRTPISREQSAVSERSPSGQPALGPESALAPLGALVPRHSRAYPLDGRSRAMGSSACSDAVLTTFAGQSVPFVPAARVSTAFRGRLVELERVVLDLSRVFYGRAPSAILVASSFDCRSVSGKNQLLSEHALGNAIDITGFRFAADGAASEGAGAFEVRVDQHWKATGNPERERHARFLEALTQALLARDVFRTLLGPAHPNHADHFHFDMAPHYYIDL
jgi:hypothetical protein